ncbi:MAG TPA: hypothetical protein VN838_12100 [Bradyrhizobium sp.]|nr:hypothetical protein [Bradyrhizobium sp.]
MRNPKPMSIRPEPGTGARELVATIRISIGATGGRTFRAQLRGKDKPFDPTIDEVRDAVAACYSAAAFFQKHANHALKRLKEARAAAGEATE